MTTFVIVTDYSGPTIDRPAMTQACAYGERGPVETLGLGQDQEAGHLLAAGKLAVHNLGLRPLEIERIYYRPSEGLAVFAARKGVEEHG